MNGDLIPAERIESKVLLLRSQKVMLDRDLAALYGVPTKVLKQAVNRNAERFPDDFAFVLDNQEVATLRSQFVTSKSDPRGGVRYAPMAFTEQGVAMLSSVLHSPRAIQVNIAIMRAFARLRHILASHADLAQKLDELEKKYDAQFKVVFDALRALMSSPEPRRKQIGFSVRERRSDYWVWPGKGFHVALVEPEIPPNTGNIARLCAATGTTLHLVGTLGFSLASRDLKRAGLDYWESVTMVRHRSLEACMAALSPARFFFFSARGQRSYTRVEYVPGDVLVFGTESRGLPEEVLAGHADQVLTIPMKGEAVRSLNLATAVGIVLYEALRQAGTPLNTEH